MSRRIKNHYFLKGNYRRSVTPRAFFMDILDEVSRRRNGDSTKKTFDEIVIRRNCFST